MATSLGYGASPTLHIARVPGELGPVFRCSGELTMATCEGLKRQLDLLISMRLPALILNVSGCRALDLEGALLVLETYQRLREHGRRFAVVAGTETTARILHLLGVDSILPVYSDESAATQALQSSRKPWGDAVAPPEVLDASLTMWRSILEVLEEGPTDAVLRRISDHSLCQWAEEVLQAQNAQDGARCYLCPLFHAVGARAAYGDCQSITLPVLKAVLARDRSTARAQVARLIRIIETTLHHADAQVGSSSTTSEPSNV